MNIAVVDTGLDYTHADFGGAGTTEAYQTALNSTADPLTDPKVSKLLDKTKFKGGYDYAGATYNPNAGNNNPTPDANPIDGQGGHHARTSPAPRWATASRPTAPRARPIPQATRS